MSRHRLLRPVTCAALSLSLLPSPVLGARQPAVSQASQPPPAEISTAVAALLGPEGQRVTLAEATLDFWWLRSLPLQPGATEPSWRSVPAGALTGVVRLEGEWTDIRGYTIRPGVYTLRFALQPQNGDHLGISPYREFFLLAPAAADAEPPPLGYDDAVKLSTKASRRSHPASMSLDPPDTTAEVSSLSTNEFGHDVVVFTLPVTSDGAPAGSLTFGLVVRGTIEH